MKLFKCTNCGQLIYFENSRCEKCGHGLGFNPDTLCLAALVPAGDEWFTLLNEDDDKKYRYCSNHIYEVCNWLTTNNGFCRACSLNRTIPDLSRPEYLQRWTLIETAKHRLIYSLLRMELPLASKMEDPERGLCFDFISDSDKKRVLTGHANGLITINIAEADDIEREMIRRSMDEQYRTVLGHFRHEVGHYYWDRLVAGSTDLDEFRRLFGDETQEYASSLEQYYSHGPALNWNDRYITPYASAHPWEDWAETWAHYLHIIDTLETAYAFGLSVNARLGENEATISTDINADPYTIKEFATIFDLWLPLTFTLNSLNRSMGLKDPYPFIIRPEVIEKLGFIHAVCHSARDRDS